MSMKPLTEGRFGAPTPFIIATNGTDWEEIGADFNPETDKHPWAVYGFNGHWIGLSVQLLASGKERALERVKQSLTRAVERCSSNSDKLRNEPVLKHFAAGTLQFAAVPVDPAAIMPCKSWASSLHLYDV